MKHFLKWSLILLVAASASAQSTAPTQNIPSKRLAKTTASKPRPAAITARDVKALRDALTAQQQQMASQQQEMQQLRQQVQQMQQQLQETQSAASAAQTAVTQAQTAATEQQQTYKTLAGDVTDIKANATTMALNAQEEQKRLSGVDKGLHDFLGRFRWSGDARVRQEDFFLAGQNPRVRERIRLRFNVEGDLGQDFVGGLSIATGNLADPTSTNETLTNFFEKKVIGFDRGFVTYNPKKHKWLSLTGGKFAYTWIRTPQTFDSDLNPEGFSEKLSFDLKDKTLKNFTVTGMQLLFNENSTTRFGATGVDSFAAGAQISGKLSPGKRWTLTPAYSLLNWRGLDVLLNASTNGNGQTPGNGTASIVCTPVTTLGTAPSCSLAVAPFAPNGFTNSYRVLAIASNGNVTRSFLGRFLYSDLILDSTIDTGKAKWPWRVLLEYEDNLHAPAPVPGRSPASHTYLVETSIGQAKNKGDVQLGYAWLRQEKDSALAAFVESDQRTPTNLLQHRLYANYRAHPRITLAYTLWVGRVLDTSLFSPVTFVSGGVTRTDALQPGFLAPGVSPGQPDHYLKRIQFDVVYSF